MDMNQYNDILAERRERALKESQAETRLLESQRVNTYKSQDISTQQEIVPISELLANSSSALYRIPVFLSYARPYNDLQNLFLDRVIAEIRSQLLFPRTLGRSDQYTETPLTAIRRMIISSYGLMAVAFRRAFIPEAISRPDTPQQENFNNFWLSSPYLQIEPSMAYQQGLPLMLMVEDGVSTNSVFGGVLEPGAGPFFIARFSLANQQSIVDFFNSVFWLETFSDWVGNVRRCYDKRTQPTFKCSTECN